MKDYRIIYNNICTGLTKYVKENHMSTMILGISGGIDSTICAVICNEVSKQTGVKLIGVSLMCNTNKDNEVSIADEVGELFCDEYYKVNIEELYKTTSAMFSSYAPTFNNTSKIAEGNIKARLRMMYLWHLGGLRNGVVIDTDNLTEHYLGFWTLHGDSNYITPIGDLWKTEVYSLTSYIRKNCISILDNPMKEREHYFDWYEKVIAVLNKAIDIIPTDGNGVSNSDLEQIGGKSYDEVDDVLKSVVCGKFNTDEYIRLTNNYGVETVNKIIKRYKNSEFKRKHLPLVIDPYTGEICEDRIPDIDEVSVC